MIALLCLVLAVLTAPFKSRSRLEAGNAVLRHQLIVLQRKVRGRVRLTNNDRRFLIQLYRWFPSILQVLTIVQPETLVRWHRAGFRCYWRWKSRPRGGRPQIETDLRALIRWMSIENPLWGAPRIHGELLKLGFEVAQSSVAKYMVKRRGSPSQGWRTFLRNHAPDIAAMDLFVVPTIGFDLLYAFIIVRLDRRDLVWINVTSHPTAEWIARQITEAFPWDDAPQYLIRDRDQLWLSKPETSNRTPSLADFITITFDFRSHGEVDSNRYSGRVRLLPPTLEATMQTVAERPEAPTAIRTDLGAIFVSLELSRSTWLITSLSPGGGEKMSKHVVRGGDVTGLLERFAQLREKTRARTGKVFSFVVIQEAGLDGFWIDRVLQNEGIESHVVDPASIATSRRRRRAKTDRIDGEALVRALLAYKRGEPRVCVMVKAPTPEEEDRRRLCRERKVLIAERIRHVNRVKGLLFSQGISGYEPLRRDRRERLVTLQTGDGRLLPDHLKAQVCRELDRLELLLEQIKAVEAERDVLLAAQQAPAAMLLDIKGIGPEFAAILWSEGLFRHFDNRRQVASYAGLAPTPWQSGSVDREQGVSKAGNPRLRTTLIQLAWLWLRHQPQSALALWFEERVRRNGDRLKKTTIVALARKLLVALWKYVTAGVVIEGAVMKAA